MPLDAEQIFGYVKGATFTLGVSALVTAAAVQCIRRLWASGPTPWLALPAWHVLAGATGVTALVLIVPTLEKSCTGYRYGWFQGAAVGAGAELVIFIREMILGFERARRRRAPSAASNGLRSGTQTRRPLRLAGYL